MSTVPQIHAPSTAGLLQAWDEAQGLPTHRRPLRLLAACEDEPWDWETIPIGARDALLLKVREHRFGTRFQSTARCPYCDEMADIEFDGAMIRADDSVSDASEHFWSEDEWTARFRLPNTGDFDFALGKSGATARCVLLERCVSEVRRKDAAFAVDDLPEDVIQKIGTAMAEADPMGDIQIALVCPACGQSYEAQFDIAAYLWLEVDDWAKEILDTVHILASAYGWSEAAILAMSATRRRMYREKAVGLRG